jgi:hypothetical protein
MAPQIFLLFLFVALFVRSRTRGVLMRACGVEDDALSKVSGAMSDACGVNAARRPARREPAR